MKSFFSSSVSLIPRLQQLVRPRRQLRVLRNHAEPLLVGEDLVAQRIPALVEQMHVADLLDPFRCRMVRRMGAARARNRGRTASIRIDVVQLVQPVDRVVRHRGGQVPAGMADIRVDRRGVAEQVRLPLAGVAADEAIEVFEAHAGRPLIERPGLARRPGRRVVVLAEPGRAVAVLQQDAADRGAVLADDAVVAGKARRRFGDHAEADRMVVAAGDQRRPGRRAQRGRVEIGVAQPVRGDAVQRRRRNHAAESGRRGEADVVGHDQQDIRRALRRHHARRPRRLGLGGVQFDLALERLRRRRQVPAINGCRGVGRPGEPVVSRASAPITVAGAIVVACCA